MPPMGSGPVNYSNPSSGDPFGAFDNQIRYNDMLRYQTISQYQQNIVSPASMTWFQANQTANQARFQYGVMGGQNQSFINRQNEMSRGAMSATAVNVMGGQMAMSATGAIMAAAGVGGIAGLAGSIAAPMIPMYFVTKGVENSMMRQRYMHQIASDVEQYRDRLGFNGLTYNQASQLGNSMAGSMFEKGQFFNKEQQMSMHKIALSNDMMSSRGVGLGSGGIKQYQKNFEELKATVKEVVTTLQTTMEGGMSVIKELQISGFSNMRQIKQQIKMANALGGATGIGAQNMMLAGQAGAQAVQGTPYSAATGARTYQMGAVSASAIANSSVAGATAVQRVGGIAAAGGVLARAQLNVFSSGMGTKLAAYMMKSDGSIDEGRLGRVMTGHASAYEIVSGANSTGYAMGSSKVRIDQYKANMAENLQARGPAAMMAMTQQLFKAWGANKYAKFEDKAYAFAGQFTNSFDEQQLMFQSLISNSGVARANAAISANSTISSAGNVRTGWGIQKGSLAFGGAQIIRGGVLAAGELEAAGKASYDAFNVIGAGIGKSASGLMANAISGVGTAFGFTDQYGSLNRARLGSTKNAIETAYGLRMVGGAIGASIGGVSKNEMDSFRLKFESMSPLVDENMKGVGVLVSDYGAQQVNNLATSLSTSLYNGTTGEISNNSAMMRMLGVNRSTWNSYDVTQQSQYAAAALNKINSYKKSVETNLTSAQATYDNLLKSNGGNNAVAIDAEYVAAMYDHNTGRPVKARPEIYNLIKAQAESEKTGVINNSIIPTYDIAGTVAKADEARNAYLAASNGRVKNIEYESDLRVGYYSSLSGGGRAVQADPTVKMKRILSKRAMKEKGYDLNTTEGFNNYIDMGERLSADGKLVTDDFTKNLLAQYRQDDENGGVAWREAKRTRVAVSVAAKNQNREAAANQYIGGAPKFLAENKAYKEGINNLLNLSYSKESAQTWINNFGDKMLAWSITKDQLNNSLSTGGVAGVKKFLEVHQDVTAGKEDPGAAVSRLTDEIKKLTADIANPGKAKEKDIKIKKDLRDQLEQDRIKAMSDRTSQTANTQSGPAASPAAPVLNYWNNTWSL